ncbi:hypothetical protein ACIBQ6_11605 [Nonomuraea sp. NPDC049655]|uniref:hypothetical protein n=1 Tax=Nonomuraea sp. NPDC049655 TaxID=3364355 RepID=UPI0037A830E1
MTAHDRGDAAAEWPCRGSAVLALPAATVARFAPGGSTVEYVSEGACRLTLGAWSWPGLAGLLLTFDADLAHIEPAELRQALCSLGARIGRGLDSAAPPRPSGSAIRACAVREGCDIADGDWPRGT